MQAVLQIFNKEFEDLPKMNPTVAFQKPYGVKQGSNGSIQIHHTNNHWVVSHLENKQVFIYDSLNPATLSEELSKQLSLMYGRGKENGATSVKLANVQTQSNGIDCGLYAIANATTIAFGEDPEDKLYKDKVMWQHLIQCFEAQILTPFPAHAENKITSCCLDRLNCLHSN